MRRIQFFLTCWLLSIAVSCGRNEIATNPTPTTQTKRAGDAESAPADGAVENSTEPRDDSNRQSPTSGHASPAAHTEQAQHPLDPRGHSPATGEGDRVTTVPVPDGGRPVAAKTGADGTVHLLFASADVALGTNAWKLKLPQEEWGFYYARLEPSATAFSTLRNINRTPSEGFSLACDEKGKVTACWLKDKLYANVSIDNGKTFADAVEIDPAFDPCNCCTTSSVYASDGTLAVLYREETNDERDMFLVSWDQERNQVSRTRVSSTLWNIETCPMSYYTISRDLEGFVAVWPTKDQIYFARLDNRGKPSPPTEIKTPGRSGMRTGIIALSAPDGSTLVAWKKDEQLGWQLYDAKGRRSGSPGSAPSSGNGAAGIVDKNGDFILFL